MDEIELDLRHLPPPEPLLRILDALDHLGIGQCLCAWTPCRPYPLLEMLDARHLRYEIDEAPGGGARIRIRYRDDGAGD